MRNTEAGEAAGVLRSALRVLGGRWAAASKCFALWGEGVCVDCFVADCLILLGAYLEILELQDGME
jgi:hypothetical protein